MNFFPQVLMAVAIGVAVLWGWWMLRLGDARHDMRYRRRQAMRDAVMVRLIMEGKRDA